MLYDLRVVKEMNVSKKSDVKAYVLERIKSNDGVTFLSIHTGASSLFGDSAEGSDVYRIVDSELQRLRRRGEAHFVRSGRDCLWKIGNGK